MNKAYPYFKWSIILVCVIAILWFLRDCNRSGQVKPVEIKIDTVWKESKDSLIYQPVPYKVTYIKEKILHDTLTDILVLQSEADTALILEKYFATRFYDSSINIQYGSARLKDTVTQNRITGRSFILSQSIPLIKETIILQQPKRFIAYIGVSAIGSKTELPFATEIDFGFKFKKDYFFEIGSLLTKHNEVMYKAGFKFPIKFRK